MIKAIIVEDENPAAERLKKILQEVDSEIEIINILDSVESTVIWLKKNSIPDLLFLDIQLADGRSFEIFDHININCPVIFTTAYDEFAIKAFELNSIDYLLKPIKIEELTNSIKKYKSIKQYFSESELQSKVYSMLSAIKESPNTYKNRFLVSHKDTLIPVPISETAYFYAEDKSTILVTTSGQKYFINYTLDALDEMLDPLQFYRVNRQFIVSAGSILKVYNYFNYKLKIEIKPSTDKEITISKEKSTDFKGWLNH